MHKNYLLTFIEESEAMSRKKRIDKEKTTKSQFSEKKKRVRFSSFIITTKLPYFKENPNTNKNILNTGFRSQLHLQAMRAMNYYILSYFSFKRK